MSTVVTFCNGLLLPPSHLTLCSIPMVLPRHAVSRPRGLQMTLSSPRRQDCDLYLCEARALQKEMEMALIMNVAALKLCCKESKEDACALPERRPWPDAAAGARLATVAAKVLTSRVGHEGYDQHGCFRLSSVELACMTPDCHQLLILVAHLPAYSCRLKLAVPATNIVCCRCGH